MAIIKAYGDWKSNAAMIRDACVPLGYLGKDRRTLDPTYGYGNFWTLWKPDELVASDLNPEKSPVGESVDATNLPHDPDSFDDVVIDGPYQLNGTPDLFFNERYGTDEYKDPHQRHGLIKHMMSEAKRVMRPEGHVLVKCQAQTSNGRFWHQPYIFIEHGGKLGLELIDELQYPSYRAQPRRSTCRSCDKKIMLGKDKVWRIVSRTIPDKQRCSAGYRLAAHEQLGGFGHLPGEDEQTHAHRNFSTLLVFRK